MKEIVLSVKRQKTEIKIFCVCIALAYLMNIISIITYGTSWSELWTQSLWMLLITCGFYGLSVVLRLLYYGVCQLRKWLLLFSWKRSNQKILYRSIAFSSGGSDRTIFICFWLISYHVFLSDSFPLSNKSDKHEKDDFTFLNSVGVVCR